MPGVERVKSGSSNKKWCRIQNWTMKTLKYQDRKTNKALTIYGGHHLRADMHRLYIKRCNAMEKEA